MATTTWRRRVPGALGWITAWTLILIVLVFAVIRFATDVPHLTAGTAPANDSFEARYVAQPIGFYLHIVSGLIYLLIAPFQVSKRIRRRSIDWHRRLGKIAWPAGIVAGLTALYIGITAPFGGFAEASATVVFGLYFLAAIAIAIRAIKRRDIATHRTWMTRAFVIALAVGTIRLVVGLAQAFGLGEFEEVFGPSFWVAFSLHLAFIYLKPRAATATA